MAVLGWMPAYKTRMRAVITVPSLLIVIKHRQRTPGLATGSPEFLFRIITIAPDRLSLPCVGLLCSAMDDTHKRGTSKEYALIQHRPTPP